MKDTKSWKALHIAFLKFRYEAKAAEWTKAEFLHDDRLVFVNVYRLMIEALSSLPENPNNYVCVAMNAKMEKDRQMLDKILDVFRDR